MTICSAVQLRQSQSEEKWSDFTYFNASGDHFAKHQVQLRQVVQRLGIVAMPLAQGRATNLQRLLGERFGLGVAAHLVVQHRQVVQRVPDHGVA